MALRIPKQKHNAEYWARVTKGLDFSKEDLVDPKTFNRILWQGLKGARYIPVTPVSLRRVLAIRRR